MSRFRGSSLGFHDREKRKPVSTGQNTSDRWGSCCALMAAVAIFERGTSEAPPHPQTRWGCCQLGSRLSRSLLCRDRKRRRAARRYLCSFDAACNNTATVAQTSTLLQMRGTPWRTVPRTALTQVSSSAAGFWRRRTNRGLADKLCAEMVKTTDFKQLHVTALIRPLCQFGPVKPPACPQTLSVSTESPVGLHPPY